MKKIVLLTIVIVYITPFSTTAANVFFPPSLDASLNNPWSPKGAGSPLYPAALLKMPAWLSFKTLNRMDPFVKPSSFNMRYKGLNWACGIGVSYASLGIDGRNKERDKTGEFDHTSSLATVGFGLRIGWIRIGAGAGLLTESSLYANLNGIIYAGEIGHDGLKNLSVGLRVQRGFISGAQIPTDVDLNLSLHFYDYHSLQINILKGTTTKQQAFCGYTWVIKQPLNITLKSGLLIPFDSISEKFAPVGSIECAYKRISVGVSFRKGTTLHQNTIILVSIR